MNERSTETPNTDEAWSRLTPSAINSVSLYDACRLEIERSRVAPSIREKITDPVYSVKKLFSSWEHLVRRMESDWKLPGQYPISAYINDLDARDQLQIAMGTLTDEAQAELSALLAALDARFVHESVPDEVGELRPWLKPSSGEPHGFWLRKPRNHPW
ncbi:hypothetical protein ACFU98_32055 [Streptomyces sp. NPDC057575]|uniref:hypothetical protein n=1 Tax=unclassified Streptomyces TaxID=2593676 RepID=UPI0036CD0792